MDSRSKIKDKEEKAINPSQLLAQADSTVPPEEVKKIEIQNGWHQTADKAYLNSNTARKYISPSIFNTGRELLKEPAGYFGGGFIANLAGIPVTMVGAIVDPIKASVAAVVATEEKGRGWITTVISNLIEKNPVEKFSAEIHAGFIARMNVIVDLLDAAGLEKREVSLDKLEKGEIEEIVALTLLHIAYTSRHRSNILLLNDKELTFQNCPENYKTVYQGLENLKEKIEKAVPGNKEKYGFYNKFAALADAETIITWIKPIKDGKILEFKQGDSNLSKQEIRIINEIILELETLKSRTLRVMPVPYVEVGSRVRSPS